ncbi:MAG: hypothetical protein ABWZ39_15295, partial [Pseudomonas caspiana]
ADDAGGMRMALLEGAMDLSLDAFRELKAAPDQWMGSEAAHYSAVSSKRRPCRTALARDSVSTGDLFIDKLAPTDPVRGVQREHRSL